MPALQALLLKLDGVKRADVDWKKGEVLVKYDPDKVQPSQMVQAVNESGVFKVRTVENLSGEKRSEMEGTKTAVTSK